MSRGAQTIGSIINIQSAGRDVPREQGCWILRLSAVILEAVYNTEAEAGSRCGGGTLKGIHKWASSLQRLFHWSRSAPLSDRRQPAKFHCCWPARLNLTVSALPIHECCKCSESVCEEHWVRKLWNPHKVYWLNVSMCKIWWENQTAFHFWPHI